MNNKRTHAGNIGKTALLASFAVAAFSSAGTVHAKTINVETGPLISKLFADIRCKRAAVKHNGKWTGRYWLKPGSFDGYCQIVTPDPVVKIIAPPKPAPHHGRLISVNAGRLWSREHANQRCPVLAKQKGGKWTGKWSDKTATSPSFCQVRLKPVVKVAPPKTTYKTIKVNAGQIWNQAHANQLCNELAKKNHGTWTKRWSSVGKKSSCEIKVAVKAAPPKRAPIKPAIKSPRHDRGSVREVSAGRIWDQRQANRKCPLIAQQTNGTWTNKWRKTNANHDAVCEIRYQPIKQVRAAAAAKTPIAPAPTSNKRYVSSGYIWDQNQANTKCPLYAAQNNARWTGQWRKISTNNRAECEVEFGTAQALPVVTAAPTTYVNLPPKAPAQNTREIAAGPIWDQAQANTKCVYIAQNNNGTWTGQWRKTGPNHASLCTVRF